MNFSVNQIRKSLEGENITPSFKNLISEIFKKDTSLLDVPLYDEVVLFNLFEKEVSKKSSKKELKSLYYQFNSVFIENLKKNK